MLSRGFLQLGRNIGSSQLFRRMCHQPGGFGLHPGSSILVFIFYSTFGG
uniref:Uncharacterized protein n=1 Tax=Picea sitchensis TaxID=3332 RepID=A9NSN0_PICSI|nr:unknown [Picea sitchensis]